MGGKKQAGETEGGLEESIFDNAQIMMIVMDRKGVIGRWNRAAEQVTGYTKEEVAGASGIWKLVYPDPAYRNGVTKLIREILSRHDYFENFETTIRTKDGKDRVISWNTREIKERGSDRIISVGIDITGRRRMEETLTQSEERYRTLAEAYPDQIYITGTDDTIRYANTTALKLIGLPYDQVVGKKRKDLFPPEIAELHGASLQNVIKTGEPLHTEAKIRFGEQELWIDASLVPLKDKAGLVTAVLAVARDITEQKRTEVALTQSEERYRTLAESSPDQIFVSGRDDTIRYANTTALKAIGLPYDQVVGKKRKDLFPPEIAGIHDAALRKVLDTGETIHREDGVRFGEQEQWIDTNLVPLKDQAGQTAAVLAVARDITERKRAEQRLAEMNALNASIIDNARIIMVVTNRDMTVSIWNRTAEAVTGYSRSDVIGSAGIWKKMYPDENYWNGVERKMRELLSKRDYVENFETAIVTKDGSSRTISWNTREITDENVVRTIIVGVDITEQREAELALIAYISEMAMRLKNPVEILRDNLTDLAHLTRDGSLTFDDIAITLEGQARSAAHVAANVMEFQKAIAEKNKEIPEAYRKFLSG